MGTENSHSRSAKAFDQNKWYYAPDFCISSEEYTNLRDSNAFVMASFVESVLVGALTKGINVCL